MPKRPEEAQDRYAKQFIGKVGTIEGGKDIAVEINSISSSWYSAASRNAEFGCKPGERAILVEWIPAGMQYTKPKKFGSFPREKGVDPSELPPRDTWITLPKTFEDLPVYYRRGSQAWAL